MAESTKQQLVKAFDLIKRDQLEEAITIVEPITIAEPENVDAWWLLANAASEPRDARRALVNVLKINPSYPKARDLLEKLNELHPPRDDELLMMMEIEEPEPAFPGGGSFYEDEEVVETGFDATLEDDLFTSSEIDDLFSGVDDEPEVVAVAEPIEAAPKAKAAKKPEDFALPADENPFEHLLEEDRQVSGERRNPARMALIGFVVLLVLVGLAFLIMSLMGGDDAADTDDVADTTLADPGTLTVADPATFAPETASQLEQIRSTAETEARATFTAANEANVFYALIGDAPTLIVQLCTSASPALPDMVRDGMLLATKYGGVPALRANVELVGVSVEDCARTDTLYRAFAPMDAVLIYNDNPSAADAFTVFRTSWSVEN